METYIGTSGYDYLDWRGVFYPETVKRNDFLEFYASNFNTLELNYSYYRMPEATHLLKLIEKAGNRLLFSIKAHESLTHKVTPDWKSFAEQFRTSITPLIQAAQLSGVLFQFPYSFHYEPENRRYLASLLAEFGEFPVVVEFRNSGWYNRRVFDGLKEKNIVLCGTDMPELKGLPPAIDVATGSFGYIRFHGRNNAEWWGSGVSERFNYSYSETELSGWVPRIRLMSDSFTKVFIYFNNHVRGQAVQNAMMLSELLRKN